MYRILTRSDKKIKRNIYIYIEQNFYCKKEILTFSPLQTVGAHSFRYSRFDFPMKYLFLSDF